MSRKPAVLVGITATATAAVLGLAGCGSSGDPQAADGSASPSAATADTASPQQVVSQAFSKTAAANTAKVALNVVATSQGAKATFTGSGVVQFKPAASDLKVTAFGQTGETRVVDGKVYSNTGTGWMSVTKDLDGIPALIDPSQALSLLQGSISDVSKTGSMKIRGVSSTGYTAKVDLSKAAAKASDSKVKAGLQRVDKALGSKPLPVKLWVDGQGRVTRQQTSAPVKIQGKQVAPNTQVDFFDYGTTVNITAPTVKA